MIVSAAGTVCIPYTQTSPSGDNRDDHCVVGTSRADARREFRALFKRALRRGCTITIGGVDVWQELERDDDGKVVRVRYAQSGLRTAKGAAV